MSLKKNGLSYCLIDFDEAKSELLIRILSPLQGGKNVPVSKRRVTRKELDAACKSYWDFVDLQIETGVVTGQDQDARRAFLDDLMTQGATLSRILMDAAGADKLWNLASNSEILVIATGLLHIPWEALYHRQNEDGRFLGDCCVITRWPEDTGETSRGPDEVESTFGTARIVCVDPQLASSLLIDKVPIRDVLTSDGEVVYVTSQKRAMVDDVKTVRLVHWICEHDKKGLRVASDIFYTAADSLVHRFAPGTILILTSCKTGGFSASAPGIAARISASSNCTVVAPSSLVAAEAGARFTRKINGAIRAATEPLTIAALWKQLREPLAAAAKGRGDLPPEACFSLWYGIYGNGEALVGS